MFVGQDSRGLYATLAVWNLQAVLARRDITAAITGPGQVQMETITVPNE